MIPSVDQVKTAAAQLLGDPSLRKFTLAKLQPFFEIAYLELTGEMQAAHIQKQKAGVSYTLTSGTLTLTPATASITNFGELILMEERPSGSTERFTQVVEVDYPRTRPQDSLLREYTWMGDQWSFVGATQNVELRIWYYDSGAAPASGSVGIDGSLQFLSHRTAALAAYPAGNFEMAERYDRHARGPALDCRGGFIQSLLQPMVLTRNKVRQQAPLYAAEYVPYPTGILANTGS